MGVGTALSKLFGGRVAEPVAEASVPVNPFTVAMPTAAQVRRTGYEYGIPLTSEMPSARLAASSERQQMLQQLHSAFNTCTWMSAAVGVIARTVTAGGLQLVPDDDVPEGEVPPEPPEVLRMRRLMRYTNPTEDMIQLLRNVITDLMLFGDSYIEVVTLLGEPVALYLLDATTMTIESDAHGEVTGYRQDVDGMRTADFDLNQVIHISLDAPRGGLYGVSPAQMALLPTTAWIFTMCTIQECFRRGDPPRVHVDLAHLQDNEVQRWREQYRVFNLGPKAVGEPLVTTGGGVVQVLDPRKVTDYLDAERVLRDQIIAAFGVPPAKVGIIETGNIGGGSGEAQNKSFQVNTVIPIANLLLEKLNFHLMQMGFGIRGWHLEFEEIDFRDSMVVEQVRKERLLAGAYSVNDWRAEIGKPPIDGGDTAIIETRQGIVAWEDMEAMSKASVGRNAAPLITAGVEGYIPGMPDPTEKEVPAALAPFAGQAPPPGKVPPVPDKNPNQKIDPEAKPGLKDDATQGKPPREGAYESDSRALSAAWSKSYRARRREALRALPGVDNDE